MNNDRSFNVEGALLLSLSTQKRQKHFNTEERADPSAPISAEIEEVEALSVANKADDADDEETMVHNPAVMQEDAVANQVVVVENDVDKKTDVVVENNVAANLDVVQNVVDQVVVESVVDKVVAVVDNVVDKVVVGENVVGNDAAANQVVVESVVDKVVAVEDNVVDKVVVGEVVVDKDSVVETNEHDVELEALKTQTNALLVRPQKQKEDDTMPNGRRAVRVLSSDSNEFEYFLEQPQNKSLFPKALTTVYHNLKWQNKCIYTGASYETEERILGVLGFTVSCGSRIVIHALAYLFESESYQELELSLADIPTSVQATKLGNMNPQFKSCFYSKLKTYTFGVAGRTSSRKSLQTSFFTLNTPQRPEKRSTSASGSAKRVLRSETKSPASVSSGL